MKHAGAKPSRKKLAKADRALFLQAAEALTQAAMTDEAPAQRGVRPPAAHRQRCGTPRGAARLDVRSA